MSAESRIHEIYRLKRQNCAGERETSDRRLRRAGGCRAVGRTEVASPIPGAQAAVVKICGGKLHPTASQRPQRQLRRSERDIAASHAQFRTTQGALGVSERLPIEARCPRLIESRL